MKKALKMLAVPAAAAAGWFANANQEKLISAACKVAALIRGASEATEEVTVVEEED